MISIFFISKLLKKIENKMLVYIKFFSLFVTIMYNISIVQHLQIVLKFFKVLPNIEYPKEAYQLLIKLLDLDYETRSTAEQALSHPFLSL